MQGPPGRLLGAVAISRPILPSKARSPFNRKYRYFRWNISTIAHIEGDLKKPGLKSGTKDRLSARGLNFQSGGGKKLCFNRRRQIRRKRAEKAACPVSVALDIEPEWEPW
jgi:hypothetical protein